MKIAEFHKFGITFKPLSESNLEMVRVWRNSDDVRPFMQYQEIITPEQQENWFQQLNKAANYYFVTYRDDEPFGVYNIKDIDFDVKIGETGSYLKSKDLWEGDIAMRSALSTIMYAFETLKLDFLKSHVLKNNKKVLAYNQQMGFKIQEAGSDAVSFELILSKEDFYTNKKVIRLINYLENN